MADQMAPTAAGELELADDAGEPQGRRAQRRAFRREEILRTALDLVTEGGLDAVTTTELARRTGAALGALYRFFPSKQAVIAALQATALEELGHDLDDAASLARERAVGCNDSVVAIACIVAVADAFFAQPRLHPARFRLIDEILSKPVPVYTDEDARILESTIKPILEGVGGLVQALGTAQGRRDDGDAARFPLMLWGALHGITHFIKRDRLAVPGSPQAADVAGTLLRLTILGLGATPADLARAIEVAAPRALQMSTSNTAPAAAPEPNPAR
jgi:AcrR family transcriptional regulator